MIFILHNSYFRLAQLDKPLLQVVCYLSQMVFGAGCNSRSAVMQHNHQHGVCSDQPASRKAGSGAIPEPTV
jgi:hypothetical protein